MNNAEKGKQFELLCKAKLSELGFENLILTNNTDNGADIVGVLGNTKYVFQCKNHIKNQGNKCVQEVISAKTLYGANRSVVISNSQFTKSAIQLAKPNYCILITASDFFELTDFSNAIRELPSIVPIYSDDYDLFKIYENVKKKIGRVPGNDDFDSSTKYQIRKKYGNLTNFIRSVGDEMFSIKPSNVKIKEEYYRIKDLIGKTPTLKDISENSTFSRNSFATYPFTKLQKECGDRPNVERGIEKDELVNQFYNLKNKIGHFPSPREIDEYGLYKTSYYRNKWGSFDNFLTELNLTRTNLNIQRRYTKVELTQLYCLIDLVFSILNESENGRLNHSILEKLNYKGKNLISPSTISKRFGSWDAFQIYLNEIGNQEIIEELKKVLKKFT
ncbi:hypothetical protein HME7025_00688 [Aquirufa nivalisilvae]|uniref:Restriction endonuclease type IV Mrr domain-containing protein n=1 Tax=Aquirufa nivalisilvae TaxID=2516557 RepID=A0A2S2DU50_9BACT|nr:restriction endonuclease [Aquirufa nivalisilvae]AWL08560.1 hypothetical protein HME7025_00688 [Aquirufa nivalisilvae]